MASDWRHRSVSRQAADNLTFIRSAIERSSAFTAVPGLGGVFVGLIGLVTAIIGAGQPSPDRWLVAWILAAPVALFVEVGAMAIKARRSGVPFAGPNARRFALGIAAPLVAGAAITYELWKLGSYAAMPPVWLLLYGAGVVSGGMFSVPIVRAVGVSFMAAGIAAIVTPAEWGNAWLGIAFGGLHVGFGAYIARYHGG